MSFLSKLFDKGEAPLLSVDVAPLGQMVWSSDDEAWIGTREGVQFALGYERKATPSSNLVAYATEVLADPSWLASTLEEEKNSWASKVPTSEKSEVATLRFGLIYFSMHKNQGYIFAIVEGGRDNRSWRIEYHDRHCDGLGFDT